MVVAQGNELLAWQIEKEEEKGKTHRLIVP